MARLPDWRFSGIFRSMRNRILNVKHFRLWFYHGNQTAKDQFAALPFSHSK